MRVEDGSGTAAVLEGIGVHSHEFQFLFLFQVPTALAAPQAAADPVLAQRVEREGSIWRRLEVAADDLKGLLKWEERTERLLPEVSSYLFPFMDGQNPSLRSLASAPRRGSRVYRLRDSFGPTWGRARALAPFKLDGFEQHGFPAVGFQVGLEAWLHLFEVGQAALRIRLELEPTEGARLSLLTCLRFLDRFGSLDPTSYASKVGRFEYSLVPRTRPGQDSPEATPDSGSFGPLALINFLLQDLLVEPGVEVPASDRTLLRRLAALEQQLQVHLGPRVRRTEPADLPPLLRLGQEFQRVEAAEGEMDSLFPAWFNLDRMHRFGYLGLEGTPAEEEVNRALRWLEQGHSITYLPRTPARPQERVLEIFPGDRCAGNASSFLGLLGTPGQLRPDSKAFERMAHEFFSGYFLAAHQRQLVLGLSLQCAHEAGRSSSFSLCEGGRRLDLFSDRLRDLRYLFLQFQVNAMFSEVSIHPPVQRAYEFFQEAMNVRRAADDLRVQIADLQTFLQAQRDREHNLREEAQIQRERAFNFTAAVLAALAIPLTVITGLYGTNHIRWEESPAWQSAFLPLLLGGVALTALLISQAQRLLVWWERWFPSAGPPSSKTGGGDA